MVDTLSFLAGFGTGVASSGVAYGVHRFRNLRNEQGETQSQTVSKSLKRTGDKRYIDDLVPYLQKYHLAGKYFQLTDVLVEPRVLVDLTDHDVDLQEKVPPLLSTSRVVPRIHDFPEIYASYNLESMSLAEFINGDTHVALLGMPGMGKSTALATLALMALGYVSFDVVQEMNTEHLAKLDKKEREELEEQYENLQQRALDQLREIRRNRMAEKLGEEKAEDAEIIIQSTDIRSLFPVFFHVGSIDVNMSMYGVQVDPSEPIINAYQQYATGLSAQLVPVSLYKRLEAGDCLVLIDGFDDLSTKERARIYPWLQNFMQHYGHNRIVITGPGTGYDPLLALGFTPAHMAPITDEEIEKLADKWYTAWSAAQPKKKSEDADSGPSRQLVDRMMKDNRNRSVMEIVLKMWSALDGDEREIGRRGWYERYVRTHMPDDKQGMAVLREIAKVFIDRDEPLLEGQLIELATSRTEADGEAMSNPEGFIKNIRESGLLLPQAGGTYIFRHPLITAYLGGENLIYDMSQRLPEVAKIPAWDEALIFASAELEMLPAIRERLSVTTDILYNNLFSIVRWLPESNPNSQWRGEIMKRLSAALVANSQFPTVRERAVASLVASRDPNVLFVLRQGLRHANPLIRKLSCIGLGAMGITDAIKDLRSMVVDDDKDVQMAAAQALGAIGSESALELMVQALLEGDENLRQAIAEALSAVSGDGWEVLRDAIDHQDMMVRRAAVFGLARVPTMWALGSVYKTMLEDSQWYVRSAAESVFSQSRDPETQGPRGYPSVEKLTWLQQWAASKGEGVPEGDKAPLMLVRALQQGDPVVRSLAAQALSRQNHTMSVKPLYAALNDKEEVVRSAAYEALGELQARATRPLPGIA